MAKIDVTNLNLCYDKVKVLYSINMMFTANSVTALIGPSGCGKTSFLRTLNRLNDTVPGVKVDGTIKLDGLNIYKDMDEIKLRKKVGMVFQKPNPFPMNIYDNVAYGPKIHGITNKKILNEIVERSLKQAFLWDEVKDRLSKSALSLSGGQQQRLCIARALAVEPEVILMDEPTSALDPIATSKIEELILKLKESYTVIIVTHSMQQAARISDFTGFFLLGNLVEYKETKKLFKSPDDDRTKGYINGIFG
ncbi:phosphate ABC transporter ATP-binding protein [Tissierella sp. MSJ-40]|uniref:Phosphate ABC transporter ATP-binding protein n=1 Tax=Tissierella simiarum TaxID=2841534 RepID=A0ABS6E7I5_9FIRM|nr:phosphate ABC transporter ATP-binding protein PstB [Tissierella simiarum]MBU5438188.1 phosphate ABC transporter ATP-binding protein [Tissierella simiarum]